LVGYFGNIVGAQRDHLVDLLLQDDIGMETLKTLRRLREVHWGNHLKNMTVEEAEWMIKSWPALEVVICYIHRVPMQNEIESLFKSHGIKWTRTIPEEDDYGG